MVNDDQTRWYRLVTFCMKLSVLLADCRAGLHPDCSNDSDHPKAESLHKRKFTLWGTADARCETRVSLSRLNFGGISTSLLPTNFPPR